MRRSFFPEDDLLELHRACSQASTHRLENFDSRMRHHWLQDMSLPKPNWLAR